MVIKKMKINIHEAGTKVPPKVEFPRVEYKVYPGEFLMI